MTPDPPRRLPAPRRRAVIEAAAARLFAERGYAGTRLDDVAAAAHVTKPILYRHFASKQALYLALLARHREQQRHFVRPVTTDEPFASRLHALLEGWFAYVAAHPHTWRMIFRDDSGDDAIRAARRRAQTSARAAIRGVLAAQPELTIRPHELEPTAELLRSAMAGLALWSLEHPRTPRAVLVDLMTRSALGLLRPRA